MAALTTGADIPRKYLERHKTAPVAASTVIYQGAMVCRNAAGYAVPASDTANLTQVLGRAEETVDNSTGANGAKDIKLACGVFKYNNSDLTVAHVGDTAEVADDNTVQISGTNSVAAGEVEQIDTDGAWIKVV